MNDPLGAIAPCHIKLKTSGWDHPKPCFLTFAGRCLVDLRGPLELWWDAGKNLTQKSFQLFSSNFCEIPFIMICSNLFYQSIQHHNANKEIGHSDHMWSYASSSEKCRQKTNHQLFCCRPLVTLVFACSPIAQRQHSGQPVVPSLGKSEQRLLMITLR